MQVWLVAVIPIDHSFFIPSAFYPEQACFNCKKKSHWRCVRCTMATHPHCSPWPTEVRSLPNQPGWAVCWKHPADWRMLNKVNHFFP